MKEIGFSPNASHILALTPFPSSYCKPIPTMSSDILTDGIGGEYNTEGTDIKYVGRVNKNELPPVEQRRENGSK